MAHKNFCVCKYQGKDAVLDKSSRVYYFYESKKAAKEAEKELNRSNKDDVDKRNTFR